MPESGAKAAGGPEDNGSRAGEEALTRPPTHQPCAFQEGEVAAGRFRITRFIGRGGMGEVYEAEDLELRERVALKTIRAEIARDQSAIERFKREILLARKVTHTNVCRVFDIFHHRSDTPPGEVTFLTMELLSGETLAGRLRRQGRLSTAEARPLVEQMAAALGAAHRAGITHRDFKSANVMLIPAAGDPALRVVVTDFGLAHSTAASETAVTLTAGIAGTPEYMAPEQLAGGHVGAAADIYALGVVVYEMITGTRPLVGDTPLATALKRLQEPAPSPRTHVPGLDPHWEAAIRRCLESDPALRFASAADLITALEGGEKPPQAGLGRPTTRRLWLAFASVVLVALIGAGIAYQSGLVGRLFRPEARPSAAGPVGPGKLRRSIAILGFRNLSGRSEVAWLSGALSEMLVTELGAGGTLRTISGEDVARMKVELSLSDAESFAKPTLARIRRNLHADIVVLGSYVALGRESGGPIRLDMHLQDAAAGETIAVVAQTGSEAGLFDLVSQAGAHVRRALGAGELSAADAGGVRAALPSNPEAARLYSEGLAKLRLFDTLAARDFLEKAVAADPGSSLAHSALAAAWTALGYDGRAREHARKAFELSANLSREDRLSVEGRYRETTREWDKAIEVYRSLWGFFPDNLDYGLRLARAQSSSGKAKESLATLDALRKLPPPASEDPRIDLEEATAAWRLSDYKRQQGAATRAVEKSSAQGARLLLTQALISQGNALVDLGETKKALEAWAEARRICEGTGARASLASVIGNVGVLRYRQGDLAAARAAMEESLAIRRAIGNERGVASGLNNLAGLLSVQGDRAGARQKYEESLAVWRKLGDQRGVGLAMTNIAELKADTDLKGARGMFEESLAIRREAGDRAGVAYILNRLALLRAEQADLRGAKKICEEQIGLCRRIGNKTLLAEGLCTLGEILSAEGNLPGARKSHEEALAIRNGLEEKQTVAQSRLALAALAIEEGRPAAAETPAREAGQVFRATKASDREVRAYTVVSRSLLAQGKAELAWQAIEPATILAAKVADQGVLLRVAVAAAQVHAALSHVAEATKALSNTVAEAQKAGLVTLALEARLALGGIEMKFGDPAAGGAHLEAVAKEAGAKGLGLIAAKAAAARH